MAQSSIPASGYLGPAHDVVRKNVALWQAHNRRRWELEKEAARPEERMPFVCECTSQTCNRPVMLTILEWEAAHMCPNWTAVAPGHEHVDDDGTVLLRHESWWVIELKTARPRWQSWATGDI